LSFKNKKRISNGTIVDTRRHSNFSVEYNFIKALKTLWKLVSFFYQKLQAFKFKAIWPQNEMKQESHW